VIRDRAGLYHADVGNPDHVVAVVGGSIHAHDGRGVVHEQKHDHDKNTQNACYHTEACDTGYLKAVHDNSVCFVLIEV